MIALISWLIIGLLVGWVASLFDWEDGSAYVLDVIVATFGAIVGGYLGVRFVDTSWSGLNLPTLGLSLLGAVVVLAIRALAGRVATQPRSAARH
jgi:uncharacterized membrane protein YeaQ/YmgE (transglycosylase-associated protein family)